MPQTSACQSPRKTTPEPSGLETLTVSRASPTSTAPTRSTSTRSPGPTPPRLHPTVSSSSIPTEWMSSSPRVESTWSIMSWEESLICTFSLDLPLLRLRGSMWRLLVSRAQRRHVARQFGSGMADNGGVCVSECEQATQLRFLTGV